MGETRIADFEAVHAPLPRMRTARAAAPRDRSSCTIISTAGASPTVPEQVAAPAVRLAAVLIAAEGHLARAHLDARAIHRLDEPAAGQRNDPLRLGILVPVADPADRQHGDQRRHGAAGPLPLPLRRGGRLDRLRVESAHRSALMADAVRVGPQMPIGTLGVRLVMAVLRRLSERATGWVEASGSCQKRRAACASVPIASSRKPPGERQVLPEVPERSRGRDSRPAGENPAPSRTASIAAP